MRRTKTQTMAASTSAPQLPPSHIRVTLATTVGTSWELHLHRETQVAQLKDFVAANMHVPVESQNLLFAGRPLTFGKVCDDFGVTDGSVVYLMPLMQSGPLLVRESQPAAPVAVATATTGGSSTATSTATLPASNDLIARGLQCLTEEQINTLLTRQTPTVLTVKVEDHLVVFTVMPKDRCASVTSMPFSPIASPKPTESTIPETPAETSEYSPFASFRISSAEAPSTVGEGRFSRAVVSEPSILEMRSKAEAVRDQLRQQRLKRAVNGATISAPAVAPAPSEMSVAEPAAATCSAPPSPALSPLPVPAPKRSRPVDATESPSSCSHCRKRLTLVGNFSCRCGGSFCTSHRHAEEHNCTFDYKSAERRLLSQNNPMVVAPKISQI